MAWFDLTPTPVQIATFALGWAAGWLMLWRPRPLPGEGDGGDAERSVSVSVVVPARNEEASIATLVASVVAQLRDGDELVVVDDHSTDTTASRATAAGATVLSCPELTPGWAGKPHACHIGALVVTGEIIVFLDADVCLGAGDLDALVAAVSRTPNDIVSMQPWHRTERAFEQWSMPFNIAALMGSAAFTVAGHRVAPHVAFGPVMAMTRARYDDIGGHVHASVRAAVLEDIALARRVGRTWLFTGTPTGTSFRMYPAGYRSLVEGWTKGMGIGLDATPRWAVVGTAAWFTSVAGGWITSPWFAAASLAQVAIFARRAGRFRWWAVLAAPVLVVWCSAVLVRSVVRRRSGGSVSWKGRRMRPDQDTGRSADGAD